MELQQWLASNPAIRWNTKRTFGEHLEKSKSIVKPSKYVFEKVSIKSVSGSILKQPGVSLREHSADPVIQSEMGDNDASNSYELNKTLPKSKVSHSP